MIVHGPDIAPGELFGGWQPLDELAKNGCRTLFVREKGAVFSAPGNAAHNLIRMRRIPGQFPQSPLEAHVLLC